MKRVQYTIATIALLAPSYGVALPNILPLARPGHGHHPSPRPPISPLPTPSCTIRAEPPKPTVLDTLTCTKYSSTTTVTAYTECNGCVLQTFSLGPGPVINCKTRITLPLATETTTVCSVETEGPPPVPTITASPPFWPIPVPLITATDFPPSFPLPSFLSAILHPRPPSFHHAEKKDLEEVEEVEDGLYARDGLVDPGQESIPFTTDVVLMNIINAIMWFVSALLKGQGVSTAGILPTTLTDPLSLIISGAVNPLGGTPLGPPYTSPIHDPGTNPGAGNGGNKQALKVTGNPPVKQAPLEMLDHYLAALKELLGDLPQNFQNSNEGKAVSMAIKQFMAAVNRFTMQLQKGDSPAKAASAFVKAIKAIAEELNKVHTQGGG